MKGFFVVCISLLCAVKGALSKGVYTPLRRISAADARALMTPTFKQATAEDPSGHLMNRTLVEWKYDYYKHIRPIIQFNLFGEFCEFSKKRMTDVSLVFTTVETCSVKGYYGCGDPTIVVSLEKFSVDRGQRMYNKVVVDSVKTPDINMIGHRFRIRFPNVIKEEKIDPKQFNVRIEGQYYCSYKFIVELEEPNSYFDAVPAAT
ncbi:hypothetical protein BBOV_II001760 [Babesia bovis T2Bo]|uniref:Uncharacterized protein n=1 Tax=Babesia bovis TaxID=5865 RepID=A7AT72_BABBO|nr:hypothetical protein BBOV_II001760 [Babesia bovis T2Bo]EDO06133.1 hypothetical protein BBOV_II001760 [Babesia bovis T2Bo]BAN64229.1 hypothetical protein [Babesia bovis]|eukprot:XP_001609701.1 hypothetical protein [Babesia bovis T2Bo]